VISRFRPPLNAQRITGRCGASYACCWNRARWTRQIGDLRHFQSEPGRVLARMENLDLIARQRFDNDQRRVRVSLDQPRSRRTLAPQIRPSRGDRGGASAPESPNACTRCSTT
jgi:hypothetical protein